MDGFQLVTYKKSKRSSRNVKKPTKITLPAVLSEDFDVDRCIKKISEFKSEINVSAFWNCFNDSLNHSFTCKSVQCSYTPSKDFKPAACSYKEIIVYGIGSISKSHISKYQLAWVLLLVEKLKLPCYFYDPILSNEETAIIKSYGLLNIERNEGQRRTFQNINRFIEILKQILDFMEIDMKKECKRQITCTSIFVMLHCGKSMYNNLLWKNWNCESLQQICIIGNSFSSYVERFPSRILKESAIYLEQILPYTVQHNIINSFHHEDIFNDTAIHTFPSELVLQIPQSVYDDDMEPVTGSDDVEIITNKK